MKKYHPLFRILLPALLVFFLAYTFLRTFLVDITWDEAASWLSYVRFGFWKPHDAGFMDANNHILNTLFMVIWNKVLGSEVWMLRFHTLFFSLLYLGCGFLLVKKIPNTLQRLSGFILLAAHPYLIDFLSLARGYGMSMALSMASWYLVYCYIEKPRIQILIAAVLISLLSVTAYFGQLNMALGLWAALLLHRLLLLRQEKTSIKTSLPAFGIILFLPALFLVWLIPLLLSMQNAGNFYAGGSSGLINDTLLSLGINMQYGHTNSLIIATILLLVFAISVLSCLFPLLKFREKELQLPVSELFPLLMGIMLFTALCSLVLQHFLLATPYPRDRMSIIFLPAFMVCLAWFPRSRILQPVMASIFLLHFFISMNLHSAFEWKNNADNLKLFEQLQTIKEIPQGRLKIFVAAGEDFFSVLNYYRITKQWNYLEQVFHDQGRMNPHADYFVIRANDFQKYKALPAEIVYQDLNTGNTLCRNSMLINEKPISVFQTYKSHDKPDQEVFEVKPEDEFAGELLFPAIQDSSESIQYIRATLEIFPEKAISNSTGLILSFECADSTCDYRYFNLYDRLQGQSGKWIPLEIVYPEITELVSQARIKIYLWNNNGLTFKFRNLKGERLRYGER